MVCTVCSTLSGKVALKNTDIGVLVREDGAVFKKGQWTYGRKQAEGYMQISLKKTYSVHRLVLRTFKPNPYNLELCDHINHVRDDNRVQNLRWVSWEGNNNNRINNVSEDLRLIRKEKKLRKLLHW